MYLDIAIASLPPWSCGRSLYDCCTEMIRHRRPSSSANDNCAIAARSRFAYVCVCVHVCRHEILPMPPKEEDDRMRNLSHFANTCATLIHPRCRRQAWEARMCAPVHIRLSAQHTYVEMWNVRRFTVRFLLNFQFGCKCHERSRNVSPVSHFSQAQTRAIKRPSQRSLCPFCSRRLSFHRHVFSVVAPESHKSPCTLSLCLSMWFLDVFPRVDVITVVVLLISSLRVYALSPLPGHSPHRIRCSSCIVAIFLYVRARSLPGILPFSCSFFSFFFLLSFSFSSLSPIFAIFLRYVPLMRYLSELYRSWSDSRWIHELLYVIRDLSAL